MRAFNHISAHREVTVIQVGLDGMAFTVRRKIRVIASIGAGWDHVSVSRANKCPTWDEMGAIKRLCFKPSETAMQLHVPVQNHINIHPHTLHLWRPHHLTIPMPPEELV